MSRRRQNPVDSGQIMKFALIGGAAYLLYQYFTTAAAPAATSTGSSGTGTGTGTNTGSGAAASNTGGGSSSTIAKIVMLIPTAAQMDAAATAAGYAAPHSFNTYQWNYFYTAVTSRPTDTWGPDQLYPGDAANQTDLHTSADYVNALTAWAHSQGLAGLSRSILDSTAYGRGVGVYGWD